MISRIRFFRRKTDSEYHKSCAILIFLCRNDNRADTTLTLEQPLPQLLSTTLVVIVLSIVPVVIVPLVVVLQCEASGVREAARGKRHVLGVALGVF
eukprot:scaffold6184_cov96-Amphora_coffeaeformis.AAC.3